MPEIDVSKLQETLKLTNPGQRPHRDRNAKELTENANVIILLKKDSTNIEK